jgi:hypothetical protein
VRGTHVPVLVHMCVVYVHARGSVHTSKTSGLGDLDIVGCLKRLYKSGAANLPASYTVSQRATQSLEALPLRFAASD